MLIKFAKIWLKEALTYTISLPKGKTGWDCVKVTTFRSHLTQMVLGNVRGATIKLVLHFGISLKPWKFTFFMNISCFNLVQPSMKFQWITDDISWFLVMFIEFHGVDLHPWLRQYGIDWRAYLATRSLISKLYELKMQDNEELSDHLSKFNSLVQQLSSLKCSCHLSSMSVPLENLCVAFFSIFQKSWLLVFSIVVSLGMLFWGLICTMIVYRLANYIVFFVI